MIRPQRWLRLMGFARGPLRRRSDRAQKMLFVGAIAAAFLAIPVAGDVADSVTTQQSGDTYQAYAVLAQDVSAPVSYSEYGSATTKAKASWQAPDGSPCNGEIEIDGSGKAGQRVPIWTDTKGNQVDSSQAPATRQARVFMMSGLAVLVWLVGVLTVYLFVSWVLSRRRIAAWDEEWERADREWRQPKG